MAAPDDPAPSRPLRVGLLGLGTVGAAVARLLRDNRELYAQRAGRPIDVGPVVVRDVARARGRGVVDPALVSDDPATLDAAGVDVLVEVAGGKDAAKAAIADALRAGRHVVTANKALLASDGPELFALAREHGAAVAFEASCVAGVPIVAGLVQGLMSNRFRRLDGILNGTCNFIGTAMERDGRSYAEALAEAKRLGYAEADETLDVSGADAASKLAILASLAFGVAVRDRDVPMAGIDALDAMDTRFAASMGFGIKLIASAIRGPGGSLHLSASPCLVADDHPLHAVTGSTNALCVEADPVGRVVLQGPGAGGGETAAGVVSDLLGVATGSYPSLFAASGLWPDRRAAAEPAAPGQLPGRFYLRVRVADEPGVVGRLASALGAEGISLSAFHQQEAVPGADGVPVVLLTHHTTRERVDAGCRAFGGDAALRGEPVVMRVLGREEAAG
ncbi:homoserine dehydrogenase [Phycisphaera mikurensis]|uniref:Homoserine dehydrogenase n=1 Tax=Phycisphaera mikurensis (strain NBRC 102666 / KCTC 22515 / FYK2301M01) TaxID=1142394 RepID=I0IDT0_PHYMF|nr:homoserine dehydrogenase [Phycisphaera mikurensis]MBB6441229.1 homoserine dehydrogenase [Phycisphaera mikurensis]BAM03418.1 homoserine dehydrogenase [Phycisphaera mikurensis NBRC 102666]